MAIRIVPFSTSYDLAEKHGKYSDRLLYISTGVSIIISVLSCNEISKDVQHALIALNSAFICALFYFDNSSNYIFTRAEMKRRLDLLDNAFDSKLSGRKSQEYFTNDHLSPGLYKLAVNCFENSHHSQFTISKMLPGLIAKTAAIVLLFVVSAYIGSGEIIRLFFELSLPVYLAQKLFRAWCYSVRMASIYDRFKSLFNDLLKHDFSDKTAETMRLILDYETALAWAATPLSSKVFFKNKDKLATEWDDLKQEYNINATH